MEDLSLHIMDIAENSLRAGAKNIKIRLIEDNNMLKLEIEDNGTGMSEEYRNKAINPFFTTKQGKKIGLGLSFLAQSSKEAGGDTKIESEPDKGTKIIATFDLKNIDMKPLGDMKKTMECLKFAHPDVQFSFEHIKV